MGGVESGTYVWLAFRRVARLSSGEMLRMVLGRAVALALVLWLGNSTDAWSQTPPSTLAAVGTLAEVVDTVEAANGHLFTSAGRTVSIFDLGNPAAPVRKGSYTFPEEVWSFSVEGTHAYVGANFFGLGILDVSNPSAPTLVGSFKTPGQAKAAAVAAGKAAVVDHMEGLVFVDVSNPASPSGLGTYFLDGYARDVVTAGSFAYAVDSPSGLYVVDLSKSGPLEPIGVAQTGANLRMLDVTRSSTPDEPRLAVIVGGGALQLYDVSKPQAPVKLTSFRMPGPALRVTLNGRRAYVADGQMGLQVVDLSTPATPAIVGTYKTTTAARDVAVANGLVFVATTEAVVVLRDLP